MSTDLLLGRVGAVAAWVGPVVLFVSTLLHPMGADPSDFPAAFAEYAADPHYVWCHLGQFAGFAIIAGAVVALTETLGSGRAASWAHVGIAGIAASLAVAAALQAVDGVALKNTVDRWAGATGNARAIAYETAFAVRQIEIGLAAFLSLLFGFAWIVLAAAILESGRYPRWLGLGGMFGGLATTIAGTAQGYAGFSAKPMVLSMIASVVLLIWTMAAGALLWRAASQLRPYVSSRRTMSSSPR
jgi:hypothetical protein